MQGRKEVMIHESWKILLQEEFELPYFRNLTEFLKLEKSAGHVIYPPGKRIFAAFELTPVDQVKVVIIGQDPYHGAGQANGLCFSVAKGARMPPSLVNIFKELQSDLGIPFPDSGSLDNWAKQGVLLLNATLTVREASPGSHQKKGWEEFTDAVIRKLNEEKSGVIFLLWGNFAQQKAAMIDPQRHHVLKAAHPSPLARTGFKGCKHFSKANELLIAMGQKPIDWNP